MKNSLAVIYCFPRSGGTLLNQCLLCAPENVVLSEVNPAGSVIAPEKQAEEWFKLLSPDEASAIKGAPYLERIGCVARKAAETGRILCLRDWTGINFLDGVSPWLGQPSGQLEQRVYLRLAGCTLSEIALLRRSRSVFESIRANVPELSALTVERFAAGYHAYLAQIAANNITCHRLEEFTSDQHRVLQSICAELGLKYASDFAARFHLIKSVTGNTTLPRPPASASWQAIHNLGHPPEVTHCEPSAKKVFEELDRLAGYLSLS